MGSIRKPKFHLGALGNAPEHQVREERYPLQRSPSTIQYLSAWTLGRSCTLMGSFLYASLVLGRFTKVDIHEIHELQVCTNFEYMSYIHVGCSKYHNYGPSYKDHPRYDMASLGMEYSVCSVGRCRYRSCEIENNERIASSEGLT